jgi:triphosphoribosyl-dephospho-CoA synthase
MTAMHVIDSPQRAAPQVPDVSHSGVLRIQHIRRIAVHALLDELVTFPKPGLVSLEDNGSHRDMTAAHFVRSARVLRRCFARMAEAGAAAVPFATLRGLGIAAEADMLAATGGVNTHRGAIFNIGLLAAAAGIASTRAASAPTPPAHLGQIVQQQWGDALAAHSRQPCSHGAVALRQHGAAGAIGEALAGFPTVYEVALPAYRAALQATGNPRMARVQAFFALLAVVNDTNLLHRGGQRGLDLAQVEARGFLDAGGVHSPGWLGRALQVHKIFVAGNLSPGGCADLLAACLFVHAFADAQPITSKAHD